MPPPLAAAPEPPPLRADPVIEEAEPVIPAEPSFGEAQGFDLESIPAAPAETEPVSEAPTPRAIEPPLPHGPFTGFVLGDAPRVEIPEFEEPEPVDQVPGEVAPEQAEEPQQAPYDLTEPPAVPAEEAEPAPEPVAEEERAPFDLGEMTIPEPVAAEEPVEPAVPAYDLSVGTEHEEAPVAVPEMTEVAEAPAAVEETVEPLAPVYDLSAEVEEEEPAAIPETPEVVEPEAEAEHVPFDLTEFAPEAPAAVEETVEPMAPVYDLSAEIGEEAAAAETQRAPLDLSESVLPAEQPVEEPSFDAAQPGDQEEGLEPARFDLTEYAEPQAAEPAAEEQREPSEFDTYAATEETRIPFDFGEQPWELPAEPEPFEAPGLVDTAPGAAVEEVEEQPAPSQAPEAAEHFGPLDLTELPQAEPFDFAEPPAPETTIELSGQPPVEPVTPSEIDQAGPQFAETVGEEVSAEAPEFEEAVEPQAEAPATHHVIPTWVSGFEGVGELPEAEVPEFAYPEAAAVEPGPAVQEPQAHEEPLAEERQPFDLGSLSIPEAPDATEPAPVEEVEEAEGSVAEEQRQPFDLDSFSIPEVPPFEEPAEVPWGGIGSDAFAQTMEADEAGLVESPVESGVGEEPVAETPRVETPEFPETEEPKSGEEPGLRPFDFGEISEPAEAVVEELSEIAEEPWQSAVAEPLDLTEMEAPEAAEQEPVAFEEAEFPVTVEHEPIELESDAGVAEEEPVPPKASTRFVLEDEPDIELAEFEIPQQAAAPVESVEAETAAAVAGAAGGLAAVKVGAAATAVKIAAGVAAIAAICATIAVRLAIGAGKAAGRIGKVIKERSSRAIGLISRYRAARRSPAAPAAGPARIEEMARISEFEQGLLDRLAPAAQVYGWAEQLMELNADTDAALIELAGAEEAQSGEIRDLIETMRSAVQEDVRQSHEVKDNPYSLYWTLWLKDERETLADDLNSLIELLDPFPQLRPTCLRLAELRSRYQRQDPNFYAHFGNLVLLYDLYPPKTIADLAAKSGASRCGRALS